MTAPPPPPDHPAREPRLHAMPVLSVLLGALLITNATTEAIVYPLLLGAVSLIGSIIGCSMVKAKPGKKIIVGQGLQP